MKLFAAVVFVIFVGIALGASSQQQKHDPNDNMGNTPFFLLDPKDQTCLGPSGFTVCDERSLWILTRRVDRKKTYSLVSLLNPSPYGMCLERKKNIFGLLGTEKVGIGLCSNSGAKNWEFEFIDKNHVRLATEGQCLVRGKKKFKNSVSVQSCKKGEMAALLYHAVNVHDTGFYLKAADGACFDGSRFRSCDGASRSLLWGIGIKYVWGKANRYFYSFGDTDNCIVASGSTVEKASCNKGGALKWGLSDGQLSVNNGKACVARLGDNRAEMAKCSTANEYISMEVPQTFTQEELEYMLKNPDKLKPEEKAYLQQILKAGK